MTNREQITHNEAYRAARTLFDYCNGRMCRICIFAEKVDDGDFCRYECQFQHIIPRGMGEDMTTALLVAKENIDVLRKKYPNESNCSKANDFSNNFQTITSRG